MKICGIDTDNCPEVVLAFLITDFQFEGENKNFFLAIQQINRFGPKIAQIEMIEYDDQVTDDQIKWLFWWSDYFSEIKKSDQLSGNLFDAITIWERTGKIDEPKWRPAGNWQDYNGISFT